MNLGAHSAPYEYDLCMTIKVLTPQDVEAYRAIRLEALRNEPAAFGSSAEDFEKESLESIAKRLQAVEFGNFTLGAFDGEQLVGIATFFVEPRAKTEHKGHIFGMYVTPKARGKGIAKALLTALIERVRTYPKIKKLNLSVMTTQQEAKRLYVSLGFETYGFEKQALKLGDTYFDSEDMVLFL
jgi:ribosomal protein S18 acetylase RimI-like enzyme